MPSSRVTTPITAPCGDADQQYGFTDRDPDNGLSYRVKWLYEVTYDLGFSWSLARSVEWVSELFGSVELSSLGAKDEDVTERETCSPPWAKRGR